MSMARPRGAFYVLLLLLFLGTIYTVSLIRLGADVTDYGVHLAKQEMLILGQHADKAPYEVVDLSWGSNLVGALWNRALPGPSLYWSKLGVVVILWVGFLLTRFLIRKVEPDNDVLRTIGAFWWFPLLGYGLHLIDYYTWPTLILASIVALYVLWFSDQRLVYELAIGCLIAVAILSRLTLVTLLTVPVLSGLLRFGRVKMIGRHVSVTFAAAAVTCLLLGFIGSLHGSFVRYLGALSSFASGLLDSSQSAFKGDNYSLRYQLVAWLSAYRIIIVYAFLMFVVGTTHWFVARFSKPYGYALSLLIGIGALAMANFDVVSIGDGNWLKAPEFQPRTDILLEFILPAAALIGILVVKGRSESEGGGLSLRTFAYVLALWLLILTPLGSDTFASKLRFGLMLPLAILTVSIGSTLKEQRETSWSKSMAIVLGMVLIASLPTLLYGAYFDVYRESKQVAVENESFSYPGLRGIRSTPERVKVLDEAVWALSDYTTPGDSALVLGKASLLPYLAELSLFYPIAWPTYSAPEVLSTFLRSRAEQGIRPDIVIATRLSVSHRTWPNTDATYLAGTPHDEVLERYLANQGYELAWQNAVFSYYQ